MQEYDTGLREYMQLPPEKQYDLKGYDELDRNRDFDSVEDVQDQCDNTILGTRTPFSGCVEDEAFAVGYQVPTELSPYILPREGTPEELDLKIDRTRDKQSIHLDIIHFGSDSAALTDDTRQLLIPIAEQLRAADGFKIEVIGHTDSTASAEHNRKLSHARALSIYDELIKLGISKQRLVASGKGEHEPIAPNDTEEGKRKNRRIEFKLVKIDSAGTLPPLTENDAGQATTADYQDPAELNPYILPKEGTPEVLNLKIDRTRDVQSIHLDLIHFKSDSADLTDGIRIVLKYIAEQLKAAAGFQIEIIGHTDNTASAAHNQQLSLARAQSVYGELIRVGVNKENLTVSGRGEYAPIATNSTEEGKRKNRRIEFKLTKKPPG